MKSKLKTLTLLGLYKSFLGLAILEGLLALWFLFRIPSETRNAFLAGYSLQRIGIGFVIILALAGFAFLLLDSFGSQKLLKFLTSKLDPLLNIGILNYLIKSSLILVLSTSSASILFFLVPVLQRLIFFLPDNYIFVAIGQRAGLLIGWVFLISVKTLILYYASGRQINNNLSVPVRLTAISWTIEAFILIYFGLWSLIARKLTLEILLGPGIKILILSVWFSIWALLNRRKDWADRIFLPFVCVTIWLSVFIVSMQLAQWLYSFNTSPGNHFNLLADSILHGKISITNPTFTHDLTFFKGNWYVPFPPFPAFLMLPFIAIWGLDAFNTTAFSLVLAATTAVTMYLILNQLIRLLWIQLSRSGAIWLTALFSFGSVYLWLSINSGSSFFSQVVTVAFCALAFLSVLTKRSPWIAGVCLAAAIMSRPSVFVLWPALLAIRIQLYIDTNGKSGWKTIFKWILWSALPILFGIGALLYYNFVRFGNLFDFGYITINGAKWIVQNVQTYGLFSTHYVSFNLYYMFLALPRLISQCDYFIPRGWGMSIITTTPAVIYLLRKIKVTWWVGGCWCSIILSIILLALYSNNGANQYGYRYVMDFIIPIIMIIAVNAGKKVSALLKTLIIASIFINYYGLLSWFKSPC